MLKITIELHSAATGQTTLLGQATIANDGARSSESEGIYGDYVATFSKWAPKEKETWKTGKVRDFPRKARGSWDLLFLALLDAVGGRNFRHVCQWALEQQRRQP